MKHALDAILERLDGRETLSPLMPKKAWDGELEARIESLAQGISLSETALIALMAGLHLRNDSLDASHSYAQEIEHDATGAYWHGLMHRMEGDFYNSKYWFRQAGRHPAMDLTRKRVAEQLGGAAETEKIASIKDSYASGVLSSFRSEAGWDSARFVDLAVWQEKLAANDEARALLERIQRIEMEALFEYTLEAARPYLPE
ncbi:hypothetical protein [Paenibacillus soyae]|uniref:Uncharacterized protein n=1 Tax=Paenibacillus soyae TaxID=2969249 RepID=A0A9X2MQN9_9BACL|nr:hypothetical protein [Paenibacillus soyae]MCR2804093.1 hypothetical protein [Paenibacillus soyae]